MDYSLFHLRTSLKSTKYTQLKSHCLGDVVITANVFPMLVEIPLREHWIYPYNWDVRNSREKASSRSLTYSLRNFERQRSITLEQFAMKIACTYHRSETTRPSVHIWTECLYQPRRCGITHIGTLEWTQPSRVVLRRSSIEECMRNYFSFGAGNNEVAMVSPNEKETNQKIEF